MTTTPLPNTAWKRWVHFWFAPSDPTTMAFIRIVTGLLVLYTHLAYSFDLYSFFGEKGWYGVDAINRERREVPWAPMPFTDGWKWWENTARLPEEPHRRAALLAYLRSLPTDPTEVNKKLAILTDMNIENDGYPSAIGAEGPMFANGLDPDPKRRWNTLLALIKDPSVPRDPKETFPPMLDEYVTRMTEAGRSPAQTPALQKLMRDLDAFHGTLPVVPAPEEPTASRDAIRAREEARQAALDARRYIVDYFAERDYVQRYNFLKFARDLAVEPEKRERKLDYFAYWGAEERYATRQGNPIFSIWFHIHTPTEMAVAHAVMLCVMLMFTLGLFTRVMAPLTWLCCVSYIHRNQQVLFGQDTMMNILLLYLMIANCGATLSLDRLITRFRAARASLKRGGTIDAPTAAYLAVPPPSVAPGFAQRMLQIHFCFIYMASGLSKLKGADWWNTGAFWSTMGNPEFTLIHYQWYQDMLRSMMGQRLIYSASAAFMVGFTFVMEIGLPFLVWTKLRPYMIIGGFFLHFGIGVLMGLLIFSLLMMTMLVSYIPGSVIRRQLFGPPPTERVRLTVDPANDAEVKKVAWAVAKDSAGKLEVVKR